MQNVRLLLLGHERFIQREFFEQSYAAPVSPAGKYRNAGKAQGIQIPLDGSDGEEQCSASSFAVPHEPLMSKKTI